MAQLQKFEPFEEVPEGSLDFIINKFLLNDIWLVSPQFKFGRSKSSTLVIGPQVVFSSSLQYCRLLFLTLDVPGFSSVFSNMAYYRMCLMDPNGNEIQSINGILSPYDNPVIFMSLCLSVIERRILPENTLRIHLSWHSWNKRSLYGPQMTKDLTEEKLQPASRNRLTERLASLSDILLNESDAKTDCYLKVGKVKISAHQAVLSARSIVFSAIFQYKKSEKPIVYIHCKVSVLVDVLKYMYSGQIHGLNRETATSMYVFAEKCAMYELRDNCLDFLKNNLTIGNVCDAAVLSHTYGETKLEELVLQFFKNRFEDIYQSDMWKYFAYKEPSLAIDYLTHSLLAKIKRITV